MENSKAEVNLKQFYKKAVYSENESQCKLTSASPTNVKNNSSHCRRFQLTIFLNQATIVTDISCKLVTPLYFFFILRACYGFNIP